MNKETITLETFSEGNRSKIIGDSLYRICRAHDDYGKWYLHEQYNNGSHWSAHNNYYSDSLKFVIDKLNSFTKEKEIVSLIS